MSIKKRLIGPLALGALLPLATLASAQPAPAPRTVATEPGALTLEESIRIALQNNGDTGAAARSFEGARQGITSARAGYFPDISANFDYDYANRQGVTTRTTDSNGSSRIVSGGTTSNLLVSQNLFDAGRTRARVNQARARALGSVGGFGSAREGVAFDVARNFFEQLRQEKLVAQRRGQVALANSQLELIRAQVEAGVAARADVQSVEVNVSQARFDLATSQNNLRVTETNFRNSLGLGRGPALRLQEVPAAVEAGLPERDASPQEVAAQTAIPLVAPDASSPVAVPTAAPTPTVTAEDILNAPLPAVPDLRPLEEYVAEALRRRPDLLQTRATVQSSEASLKLAKIERRPQLSAAAGYNLDPRATSSRSFTFGAGVSIPIFDAGARRADVRAAEADLEASQLRLSQLEKDAAADVEATYVDILGERERIANARALVESARTNLQTATEKYRLGLGIALDISNAQTQLFNAQTSLTGAVYDFELARSDLDRAVGRFAWADPGVAPPASAPTQVPSVLPGSNGRVLPVSLPQREAEAAVAAPTSPVQTVPMAAAEVQAAPAAERPVGQRVRKVERRGMQVQP